MEDYECYEEENSEWIKGLQIAKEFNSLPLSVISKRSLKESNNALSNRQESSQFLSNDLTSISKKQEDYNNNSNIYNQEQRTNYTTSSPLMVESYLPTTHGIIRIVFPTMQSSSSSYSNHQEMINKNFSKINYPPIPSPQSNEELAELIKNHIMNFHEISSSASSASTTSTTPHFNSTESHSSSQDSSPYHQHQQQQDYYTSTHPDHLNGYPSTSSFGTSNHSSQTVTPNLTPFQQAEDTATHLHDLASSSYLFDSDSSMDHIEDEEIMKELQLSPLFPKFENSHFPVHRGKQIHFRNHNETNNSNSNSTTSSETMKGSRRKKGKKEERKGRNNNKQKLTFHFNDDEEYEPSEEEEDGSGEEGEESEEDDDDDEKNGNESDDEKEKPSRKRSSSTFNNNSPQKPRKKASQFARDILMDWLVEHEGKKISVMVGIPCFHAFHRKSISNQEAETRVSNKNRIRIKANCSLDE
jgi:hypothetical protein